MARGSESLLAGRNAAPLTEREVRRAASTFLGMDKNVPFRYDEHARTAFLVTIDEHGDEYGEIVYGPDIYPGQSIVGANSALDLDCAVAHELTHYHRWRNKTELPDGVWVHLDEAMTSMEAVLRYGDQLDNTQKKQLIEDAQLRLRLHLEGLGELQENMGETGAGGQEEFDQKPIEEQVRGLIETLGLEERKPD